MYTLYILIIFKKKTSLIDFNVSELFVKLF